MHVTEHSSILKNMEEFIQKIKKSYQLLVYLYKHRKDTQQEQKLTRYQTINLDAKTPGVLQIFQPNNHCGLKQILIKALSFKFLRVY